jgi:lysophospholipase L1-like esterase
MNANTQRGTETLDRIWRQSKRALLFLLLGAFAFVPGNAVADSILKPDDRIALCGDSITEQKQYSVFIEDYLRLCQPTKVSTIQFGWGGETSWGFEPRMAHDVLVFKPTIATTCYGMNDGGYSPLSEERATKYRTAMASIIKQFKDAGAKVVVGSPGVVDSFTFRKDPELAKMYNNNLSQLRDICRQLAQENSMPFADVFSVMDKAMEGAKAKYGNEYHVAGGDGVHPSANGHLLMAYAFLKAMGVDGNIGEIKVDLASGQATASEGHKIDAFDDVVKITSTRYPFCFYGAELKDPTSTRGILEFVPFNQDLNRLTLIVTGIKSAKAKVTWGTTSREFDAKQLESGINLAAEFLDNPFADQFKLVEDAIRAKQVFETQAYKNLVPGMRTLIDDDNERAAEKTVIEAAVQKWQEKDAAVNAAIQPVTHTIKVEEVK